MVRAPLPALLLLAAALALPCEGCAAHDGASAAWPERGPQLGARGVTEGMPPDATSLPIPPPPTPKPEPAPVKHRASQTTRTIGWIIVSVGAEAAFVALATSTVILHDRISRADGCDAQKVCTTAGFGANAQIGSLVGWNAGAWVMAIAGAGVGTYLVLANPPHQDGRAEVGVTSTGTGVALSLRGSFF